MMPLPLPLKTIFFREDQVKDMMTDAYRAGFRSKSKVSEVILGYQECDAVNKLIERYKNGDPNKAHQRLRATEWSDSTHQE